MSHEQPMIAFEAPRQCRMCGSAGHIDRYGEYLPYTRTQIGELEPTFTHENRTYPHLIVKCQTCGYEWVVRTLDAEDAQTPASGPETPE